MFDRVTINSHVPYVSANYGEKPEIQHFRETDNNTFHFFSMQIVILKMF